MRFCHAVRKKNHRRGFRVYGNDEWILKRLDNIAPAQTLPLETGPNNATASAVSALINSIG